MQREQTDQVKIWFFIFVGVDIVAVATCAVILYNKFVLGV